MGNKSSKNHSTSVQWMWNANEDSFSKTNSNDWDLYSDVENMIIEEAFKTGQTHAVLDDYNIDLKRNLQISNNDFNKQRPVKRVVRNRNDRRIREERFMSNPIAPNRPYGGQYGFISPFIKQVAKELGLKKDQLPSQNETIVPIIVEKAVQGITEEGKKIGKQYEAEKIAEKLLEKKDAGMKEVWKCCAYLYSLESFLYKKLNETMRLIGSEEHEQVWRSKVRTFGPYCLLLWDNPFNTKLAKPGSILYRGAILSDDLITQFQSDRSKVPQPLRSFQAFTSCTRNRSIAEQYGDVLFIMTIRIAFTVDLSELSEYADEEEELLLPGVCFIINSIDFDKNTNKHLINLTLQQMHSRSDDPELSKTIQVTTETNASSFNYDDANYFDFEDDNNFAANNAYEAADSYTSDSYSANYYRRFGFDQEWE